MTTVKPAAGTAVPAAPAPRPINLTPDEIGLLRAVARWRRHMGITYDPGEMEWRDPHGPAVYLLDHTVYLLAGEDVSTTSLGVTRRAGAERSWHDVETVTEAVDILVALGLLPSRFSSSYREGWDAAAVWDLASHGSADFRRLFTDPDNTSFPVGWGQ